MKTVNEYLQMERHTLMGESRGIKSYQFNDGFMQLDYEVAHNFIERLQLPAPRPDQNRVDVGLGLS